MVAVVYSLDFWIMLENWQILEYLKDSIWFPEKGSIPTNLKEALMAT
jgi:hypothetical protein